MKWLLLIVLIGLVFGGGAARVRALLGAAKNAKKDFDDGKARTDDPAAHAKEINPR